MLRPYVGTHFRKNNLHVDDRGTKGARIDPHG